MLPRKSQGKEITFTVLSCVYQKRSMCKWTQKVPTCVVQGSPVYLPTEPLTLLNGMVKDVILQETLCYFLGSLTL